MSSTVLTVAAKQMTGVGFAFSSTLQVDGTSDQTVNAQVAAASTNALVKASFAASSIKLCVIIADQNCTLKTNSGSSPTNTFALIAGQPLVWLASDAYFANPFSADVTSLYVTTTIAVNLQAFILS